MDSHPKPRMFEFCFVNLDYTLVRVEERDGDVTVRATADTFSLPQKLQFIRGLAAEGFIPDDYRWFPLAGKEAYSRGAKWVIDNGWLEPDPSIAEGTRVWI